MSIYKRLAKKYDLPEKEIKQLCESPFLLVRGNEKD